MPSETEIYTNKENAKDSLRTAVEEYKEAAEACDMTDEEIASEIEDVLKETGLTMTVSA